MQFYVKALNPDGSVKFEGELGPKEVEFVVQVGMNYLLMQGALPFLKDDDEEDSNNTVNLEELDIDLTKVQWSYYLSI